MKNSGGASCIKINPGAGLIGYNPPDIENYLNDLRLIGSLSKLFNDGKIPLLYYRAPEIIYCAVFGAKNIGRADVSADAKLAGKGIGIKTFIESFETQKIAEFNKQRDLYKDLRSPDKIKKIAELRNIRLDFTKKAYDLTDLLYHCVARNEKGFGLFEEEMNYIDIEKIKLTKENKNSIYFSDGREEYKFDISKSTLSKKFIINEYFAFIDVNILDDPLEMLKRACGEKKTYSVPEAPPAAKPAAAFPETVVVPLYSRSAGRKFVFKRSGLNQWNAGGRDRNPDEVYIPWSAGLRNRFASFFPPRDAPFDVELPHGGVITMKVCQDDGKALMSNPNKALGKWLLRDVLCLEHGTVLTYEKLLEIGIDAVVFQKSGGRYKLDFKKTGEFEKFWKKIK